MSVHIYVKSSLRRCSAFSSEVAAPEALPASVLIEFMDRTPSLHNKYGMVGIFDLIAAATYH
jgi:hypothetical protein